MSDLANTPQRGGDGINFVVLFGELVHFIGRQIEQRGHLVNKGAGAAGTAAVHTHFHAAGQKQDLGVFAAQFDNGIGARQNAGNRNPRGVHFLDEGQVTGFGNAHAGAAGNRQTGPGRHISLSKL